MKKHQRLLDVVYDMAKYALCYRNVRENPDLLPADRIYRMTDEDHEEIEVMMKKAWDSAKGNKPRLLMLDNPYFMETALEWCQEQLNK